MNRWLLAFFILLFAPLASAKVFHIPLLALIESDGNTTGGVADLSLEVRDGTGRVFLDTFPLTRVATQISMRFAQQVACAELQLDCSGYDFIYTINASPGIVGGPSAGGAAAVLTAAVLLGKPLRSDVAMTGTINSGGLIGPVGGLKEKIAAAGASNLTTALIPWGSRVKDDNVTVDLVEYGRGVNASVREVATLSDALEAFTGHRYVDGDANVSVDAAYSGVMEQVANDLCNRGKRLAKDIESLDLSKSAITRRELAANVTRQADALLSNHSFYSAASYCFRANIITKTLLYVEGNISGVDFALRMDALRDGVAELESDIESRNRTTIADVETYLAVKERVIETQESIARIVEGNLSSALGRLAYAEERLESARAWSRFFDLPARAIAVDDAALRGACQSKISEAEERYSYVKTIVPDALDETRVGIDLAYVDLENRSHAVCIQRASKAKAEADIILSVVGYEESQLREVIDVKLDTVRRSLANNQRKGLFPLVAYSYYEYASSLRDDDPFSSLLFAEYALELGNLDIYFPAERKPVSRPWIPEGLDPKILVVIGLIHGFLAGLVIGWLVFSRRNSKKRR